MKNKLYTKSTTNGFNRWLLSAGLFLLCMISQSSYAQIPVTVTNGGLATPALAASYPDLNSALTDLNLITSFSGAGTITLTLGGGTETAPSAAGYTIGSGTLNPVLVGGANPIVINTSSPSTLNAAAGGVGTPSTAVQDGIIKIVGADYITIDGLTLVDGNVANPATMEFGIALYKSSATDGAQNNTIQNCIITLNRINNASGGGPSQEGSKGIMVINATAIASATTLTVTAASGSNSNNRFYTNTIDNCNYGISLSGFAATSGVGPAPTPGTFFGDLSNDVGGSGPATGNIIKNYGGGGATNPAAGIRANNQWSINMSYNNINNNDGAGVNHATTLRGIYAQAGTSASATINNNTITINGGATTSTINAIENVIGSTAAANTVNINNNTIQNCTYSTSTSGAFNGIISTASAATVNINSNIIQNNNIAGTATCLMISGGSPTNLNIGSNSILNNNRSGLSGTSRGIVITSPSVTVINNNTIDGISWTALTSTGIIDGIYSFSSATNVSITNNTVRNLSVPATAAIRGIVEFGSSGPKTIQGNQVYNFSTTAGGAGGASFTGISESTGTTNDISNNSVYSLISTGTSGGTAGTLVGITVSSGTTNNIYKNRICDISTNSTGASVSGMTISGGTTNNISNNRIGDLRAPNLNAANSLIGLNLTGGTTLNVYFNSVYLNASSTGALFGSSAVSVSSALALTMSNNSFVNLSSTQGAGLAAAHRRSTNSYATWTVASNRNNYSASTIFTDGTNTVGTLGAYKTLVSTRDANAVSESPVYLSTACGNAGFLKVDPAIATALESAGVTIAGITDDFEGDVRGGSPDIGADEFAGIVLLPCAGLVPADAGSISGAAAVCSGLGTTLSLVGSVVAADLSYQWSSSITPGGPYTTMSSVSKTQPTGNLTSPMYYIVTVTCTNDASSATAAEKSVLVNANPVVTVSPTSGTYCVPGGSAITLTANNALTYSWSPVAGLAPNTGSIVVATPSSTTTYTVTGTDGNGCIGSATSTITRSPGFASVTPSATPSSICSGFNSTLAANATVAASLVSSYAFSGSSGSYTSLSGATNVYTGAWDDNAAVSVPLGFSFTFAGTTYTSVFVQPNGFISFGAALGTDYAPISSGTTAAGVISAWGRDLQSQNTAPLGSVDYLSSGGVFTVQWSNARRYNAAVVNAERFEFQIQLYQTSNVVKIVYGNWSAPVNAQSALVGQVGLRGAANTDFNNLSVLSGGNWSAPAIGGTNAATCYYNEASLTTLPALGQTYTYSPPLASSYEWSPSTFLSSTTGDPVTATALTTTTTYTVLATTAAGCTGTGSVTVNVGAALTCTALTASGTPCAGSQTVTANPVGGSPPFSYAWTEDGTSIVPTTQTITANTGTHTYNCLITDNCGLPCNAGDLTITTNALPVVAVNPTTGLICNPGGATITLDATGAVDYVWSPAAGLSASTGASVSALPSATTTYTVSGTDGNGCISSATSAITVGNDPFFTLSPTSADICNGSSQVLSISDSYSGSFTYVTTITIPASGTSTPYPAPLVVSGVPAGAVLTNVKIDGYDHTFPGDVDILLQSPTLTNVMLLGDVGGGTDIVGVNLVIQDGSPAVPSPIVSGTYAPTNSGAIDAMPAPGPSIDQASPALSMFSGDMNGTWNLFVNDQFGPDGGTITSWSLTFSIIPDPSVTYSWSPATGLDVTTGTTVTATPAGNTVYTVTASVSSGCTSTATATINVGSLLNCSAATASSPVCVGSDFTVTANVTGGGQPYSYSWSDGSTTVYPATASITANLPVGTYNFTCLVTDDCGATCSSDVSVTVNGLPAISVSPNSGSICNPGGSAIALNASNGVSYSWSPAAGLDVSTGSSVVANPSASTDYTVTGTDANGCVNTAIASISVGSNPVISTNPSVADICSGGSVSLDVNTTYTGTFTSSGLISIPSSGTATPYPATLSVSGVPGGAVLKSVTLNGITHTFPADIDIMLQSPLGTNVVLMSDAGGSSAITDVDITLEDLLVPVPIPSPPVDGSTYSPTNTGASDDWAAPGPGLAFSQATPTLSMFSGNMNGTWNLLAIDDAAGDLGSLSGWSLTFEAANDPSLTFTWSPASGLSSTTGAPVTASPGGNTQYTVTATNASGCTSTATAQVNVGSPISCTPATVSSPLCANSNFTVTAHVSGGGVPYTYSWSDGSTTVYPATASITANLPAGTYNFTSLVTDDCGATCSSDVSVTINALPAISVSPVNGQICNPGGTAVTLTASGAASYTWSPSAGLSATTGSEVTALPSANTVYTVSTTDGNGCNGVATASIQVGYTPTGVTASANPPTVCAGDFSQLSSTATNATPTVPLYSFSASSGVYTSLSGGTDVSVVADDETVSGAIPIGFSFTYDGATYTSVYASSNGFLSFNSGITSSFGNSLNAPAANNLPLIAPLWDDFDGIDGSASYLTTGSPGSQVFTFEWNNYYWNWLAAAQGISFQAKLYEADGHIEFVYQQEAGALNTPSASIGLSGSPLGSYLSLDGTGTSPSASSSIATNTLSTKPATGQVYSFTPPALALSYSWEPAAGLKPNANVQNPETPALPAGTTVYTVTVSSNGCSATATTSVTSGETLVCSDVTTSGPLCSGGFTATAHHVGGGAPFSYVWSDGVGGVYPDAATVTVTLAAGTYSLDCIVSDGCGATCLSSVTVIVAQTPSASIAEGTSVVVCENDLPIAVTLNAVTDVGGVTYQWYRNGIDLGGQTGPSLAVTTVGSYKVVITNGACISESAVTVVSVVANPPAPIVTPSNVDVCIGALTSGDFSATCAGSQTVTFTVSSGLPLTWTSTSPSLPNFDVATMPVSFPAGSVITDIEVSVNIAHTWGGDIQMVLEAPSLQFVGLLRDPLDNNINFGTSPGVVPTLPYTFTSTGAALPTSGDVASPGPYHPVTFPAGAPATFADFIGIDPNGTWSLYVGDGVSGDGGTVENWTMTITVTLPPSVSNWYNVPVAGSSLAASSTFNPITDGGASTAAAGVQTFYAECSSSGCASPRTPVTFTVNSCGVILNSSIFVQGFYSGGGLMAVSGNGALFASAVAGAAPTDADTVRIAAMDPTCPYALVQEQLGILHTDGSISVTFTSPVVAGNAYYLRVIHRNSVETWSAAPVVLNPVTSYSFSSAATQAFGGNQADLGDGNFAIYSGDINREGAVDGSDFLELDPSIQAGDGGYMIGDLNGDGAVDGSDFLVLDPNIQNGIGANLPTCP